ncbi:Carbohydrate family 9 binding domain-like [Pseudarcicella hirudinis]|uniref:Carbohydrate family 9 binding domain-like n=1 Tax=Pseudarcicella hirudinis TaxID=1079859 RepID=A0A1I5M1D8_9BACT|nr:sugar-binding protein [Pseudarcicella hirudinis]SFP03352.1 Carbohydrate family 9 binding domain-like [Pseudarcicella hirudinis]
MKIKRIISIFLGSITLVAGCGKSVVINPGKQNNTEETIQSETPVNGIRIAWDYTTLRKVSSSASGEKYCGYARMIQLHDQSLMCVYEADGNIKVVKSKDLGNSWSQPLTIAARQEGINMAVPDILELKDQSILVCYNPRPYLTDPSRRFAIRTIKSYDGGISWKDERLLYEAGYQFENGCWEPAAVQLPNGEIQLFFANEGIYPYSDEQNISMLSSADNGMSWSKSPKIVSFRAGKRDGMPSPLLLKNGKDIVFSIEDNGFTNFKPYLIRSTLQNNWQETVSAQSTNRNYALFEKIDDEIYAGAPYLRQLQSGETILSYQGTEDRTNKMDFSEMKVVIGDENALNFSRKSVPFVIPADKSGLWNSLSVIQDNTVVALTSTNAFSNNSEVWMIKGMAIPELEAYKSQIKVDGMLNEDPWKGLFPVFVGQKSRTQARGNMAFDENYLYLSADVRDENVYVTSSADQNDGIVYSIDALNKATDKPAEGIFQFFLTADNKLIVREGSKAEWVEKSGFSGIQTQSLKTGNGYVQELAIPWKILGGKPGPGSRIGFNLSLQENTGKSRAEYIEPVSGNLPDASYTWCSLFLK